MDPSLPQIVTLLLILSRGILQTTVSQKVRSQDKRRPKGKAHAVLIGAVLMSTQPASAGRDKGVKKSTTTIKGKKTPQITCLHLPCAPGRMVTHLSRVMLADNDTSARQSGWISRAPLWLGARGRNRTRFLNRDNVCRKTLGR